MRLRPLFLLAVVLPLSDALAWGDQGHRLVAGVAEQYLTPVVQKKVAALLSSEREFGVAKCPVRTLEDAATWPDCLATLGNTYQATLAWHYDDQPLCGRGDYATYCKDGQCLSAQVERFVAVLADRHAPRKDRLEALKYVAQLVGDAHQPLHAEDNGDKSGSDVWVVLPGQKAKAELDHVWGVELVSLALPGSDPLSDLLLGIDGTDVDSWKQGTIRDWLAESHELAKDVAYGNLPTVPPCGAPPSDKEALAQDYVDAATPVVTEQIRKAGVRLANVLNTALR